MGKELSVAEHADIIAATAQKYGISLAYLMQLVDTITDGSTEVLDELRRRVAAAQSPPKGGTADA